MIVIVNWDNIKAEYLVGGISQRDLAEKYDVSLSSLTKTANKENWKALRDEIKKVTETKVQQKIIEDGVQQELDLHTIRGQLIEILKKKIADMPENSGTEHSKKIYTDQNGMRMTVEDKWNIATIFNIYSALINEDLKRAKLELEKDKEWQ